MIQFGSYHNPMTQSQIEARRNELVEINARRMIRGLSIGLRK